MERRPDRGARRVPDGARVAPVGPDRLAHPPRGLGRRARSRATRSGSSSTTARTTSSCGAARGTRCSRWPRTCRTSSRARSRSRSTTSSTTPSRASTSWTRTSRADGRPASSATPRSRKALWLLLFPFFQLTRPPRLKEISLFDGWVFVNIVVQVAYDAAVLFLLGPKALLFLGAAFFFSVGLHPLGARWIQEHYLVHGTNQETSSYYGFAERPGAQRRVPQRAPRLPVGAVAPPAARPESRAGGLRHARVAPVVDEAPPQVPLRPRISLWSRVVRAEPGRGSGRPRGSDGQRAGDAGRSLSVRSS